MKGTVFRSLFFMTSFLCIIGLRMHPLYSNEYAGVVLKNPTDPLKSDSSFGELVKSCRERLDKLKKERVNADKLGKLGKFDNLTSHAEDILTQVHGVKTDEEGYLLLKECCSILERLKSTVRVRLSTKKGTVYTPVNRLSTTSGNTPTLQHVASPNVKANEKIPPLQDHEFFDPTLKSTDIQKSVPIATMSSPKSSEEYDDPFENKGF